VDLVILGHVHHPLDDRSQAPRMIVLGDWLLQGSYLRLDESGPRLCVGIEEQGPPSGVPVATEIAPDRRDPIHHAEDRA
jgi:hypothetical protein